MANELLPLPKGASYESPTDSLPLLPKGASYEAPTGDLLPLPKGASYEAPPPPVVNNPRQFPETSMRTNVGNLIAKKYNQEVPIIDNPALQNMGIKTGAPTDADIIAQLAGPSTDNSKADIARYTLAKQNLETAKQKAQQSFKSGASQEQANEIYSKALGPISTVTPSATSWEKPEDISFAPGATGLADTWQAAKATGIALKRGAAKGEAGLSQAAGGQLRFAQDMVGMDTAGTVSTLDAIDKRVSEIGDSSSHPVQLFEGAISSIIQEIPAIAGSLLTGTAGFALTSMFANSFGQTYDDSRRKGLDVADSTMRSGAYASLEVLGEKFGLGDTLKGIKAAAKGVPAEDLTSFFAKALAKEIPGEQLTYAGQFAVDKGYELNPEAGIKAFLDGAIDTLGATVIQGGLMLGGGHVTNKAMNSIATKMPTLFARTIEAQQTQQAEQSAEAAKQSALDKWKALSATSKPAQAQPQEQAQPQQEVEAPQYADLVKQYMAQGQTKDNAILLVDQDIADQKEADNARGTITTPVGTSPEISGQPAGTQTAEGTEPYIGPTVDGAGVTTTPVESGTVQQQNPLVQAMHESGADFKNPSQVKKFVAQVAPEQVASLIEADPKAFKALLEEWKTTQPEAVQEQVAPVAEEVLTEEEPVLGYEEMLRASEQEAAATQEAEEPHVAEGRKLATQLKQVDPYNNFDFLKDPNVTPEEVAQAKDTLAEYTGKKEVPKATEESERTATIDEINASLGQLHSPEQLQANPPTVVNDYEDLPEGIKQQAQEGGASAFIDPATGKDYYVASQIPSNKIKGKILHERGAHIGLTRLIGGPRLQKLANQVLEWAKGGDALENTIAKEAAHWADYSGEEAGSERYNQEVVAYFTEIAVDDYGIDPLQDQPTGKQKVLSWLSELWQGVIEAIQKLNIDPSTLSAQDIVKMVQGAARLGTSPRESIEAKGVFTPKMMGELIGTPTEEAPRILASKKGKGKPEAEYDELLRKTGTKKPRPKKESWGSKFADAPLQTTGEIANVVRSTLFSSDLAINKKILEAARKSGVSAEEIATTSHQIQITQAVNARSLSDFILEKGDVTYNPNTFKFDVTESDDNMAKVRTDLMDLATQYNVPEDKFRAYASAAFIAMRSKGLVAGNEELVKNASALAANSKLADAKKLVSKNYKLVHLTPEEIKSGLQFFEEFPELHSVMGTWNKVRAKVLAFATAQGLFTDEHKEDLLSAMDYVPFYRIEQILNNASPKEFTRGLLDAAVNPKKLKGSHQEVNDVFDNMERWAGYTYKKAINNAAAQAKLKYYKQYLPDDIAPLGINEHSASGNTIGVWEDGKLNRYEFLGIDGKTMVYGFSGIDPIMLGSSKAYMKALSVSANISRANIVLNPIFSVTQIFADGMSAMISSQSKVPFAIPLQVLKEVIVTPLGLSSARKALSKSGIVGKHGYYQNFTRLDVAASEEAKKLGSVEKILKAIVSPLHVIGLASDNVIRQAIYAQTMLETKDEALAHHLAAEVINFHRGGYWGGISILRQVAPFINAGLQAMHVAGSTIMGQGLTPQTKAKAVSRLVLQASQIIPMVLLYAAMKSGDDDYEKLDPSERDRFIILGGDYKIPLRYDFYTWLFKAIPEHVFNLLVAKSEDPTKFKKALKDGFSRAVAIPSITPTLLSPIQEIYFNQDSYTGSALIPRKQVGFDPELQYNKHTAEWAKYFGKESGISPIYLDTFMQDYLGMTSMIVAFATNEYFAEKRGTVLPAQTTKEKLLALPSFSAFIVKDTGGRNINDFYELADKVSSTVKTFKEYQAISLEDADKYAAKNHNEAIITMDTEIKQISSQLAGLAKNEHLLREDRYNRWSAQEKADAIREMNTLREEYLGKKIEIEGVKARYVQQLRNKAKF